MFIFSFSMPISWLLLFSSQSSDVTINTEGGSLLSWSVFLIALLSLITFNLFGVLKEPLPRKFSLFLLQSYRNGLSIQTDPFINFVFSYHKWGDVNNSLWVALSQRCLGRSQIRRTWQKFRHQRSNGLNICLAVLTSILYLIYLEGEDGMISWYRDGNRRID